MQTPDMLEDLLGDPSFGDRLPALSAEAQQLMEMTDAERANPRIVALTAQKNPIYLARLLAAGNDAALGNLGATHSAETAVRRIGADKAFHVLAACALAFSYAEQHSTRQHSAFIFRYTLNLSLVTKKLTHWLGLEDEDAVCIWAGSLLYCTGILFGLVYDGERGDRFGAALTRLMDRGDWDLGSEPALAGAKRLSTIVARRWESPPEVIALLQDMESGAPQSMRGKVLKAAIALLVQKSLNLDASEVLVNLRLAGVACPQFDAHQGASVVGTLA